MPAGLKILYAAAEVVPFAKTGGLADVAGALPKVLAGMGHDVRVVMPLYQCIDREKYRLRPVTPTFRIPHGGDFIDIRIEESDAIPGVITYFIRNDYLFGRDGLYGHEDDDHRFVAYCRGIMEMFPQLGWTPDVINCNDWHTGLVPVYLKTLYANRSGYANIATLYTIHNLAYSGQFTPHIMELAGLPWELFTWNRLEFYGGFNFMKAGLLYADTLSTVSETYAKEIQTPEYGERLEGVLAYRAADLYGILNGIDYHEWHSQTDKFIPEHFSPEELTGKARDKKLLQKKMGLPQNADVPLFGIVSRLSSQKGLDLLEEALPDLLDEQAMQLVILGTGDGHYHEMLESLAAKFPKKLAVALKFDNALAHHIYAASDLFLMPSRYEPCGLGQMISLAYGTVPVVRATGGLADTVKEFKGNGRSKGNGFVFEDYTSDALSSTILRALKCYGDPRDCWSKVVQNAFACDYSWEASAKKYVKVYLAAVKRVEGMAAA